MTINNKPISQREISIATEGIENIIPSVGQTDKEIDIEFGRQTVEGIREKTKNAQNAIKHILEGELSTEEEIRALQLKHDTVFSREDTRKDQGGVIVHNSQPEDVTVENDDSVTSPKARIEESMGSIKEFAEALGLKTGMNFLGQKGVVNSRGRVLPFATKIGESRKFTIEQFEKLLGESLIVDEPSGQGITTTGKSIASL